MGARFWYHMAKAGEFEATTTGRVLEVDPPYVFAYETDPVPETGTPALTVRVELVEMKRERNSP